MHKGEWMNSYSKCFKIIQKNSDERMHIQNVSKNKIILMREYAYEGIYIQNVLRLKELKK